MVRELAMRQLNPTKDVVIFRKASELTLAASRGVNGRDDLKKLSEGFLQLSKLADDRREFRMACVSKALSDIFKRMPDGNPEDLPYIIDIALNFLAAIQAPPAGEGAEG